MIHDPGERVVIDLQLDTFHNARGLFGLPTAVMTRDKKSPSDWWNSYGDECPELKKFAIRILSLTYSSSGCERKWSAFEMVHTKKRNRLHQQKMNDLVFVMYNLKLWQKHQKRAANYQPPTASNLLDDIPSDDEWITEIEEPVLQEDGQLLNVLDRATRRAAREEQRMDENDEEISPSPNVNVELLEVSEDDIAVCVASNEVDGSGNIETDFGDADDNDVDDVYNDDDIAPMGTGTSRTGSFDYINEENFGYNED